MSNIQNQVEINPNIDRITKKDSHNKFTKSATQIADTVQFEINKNLKKTFFMMIFFTLIFILFLAISEIGLAGGLSLPEDPVDYILDYLGMMTFLMIVAAATYGGSIIAEDFQERTANLLFPKITKSRLMTGRVIAMYFLNAFVLVFYYCEIALITYIKYSEVPTTLWNSLGWALLYAWAILTFAILFSSIMKTTSAAVITTILILLIVFQMIESILMITQVDIEPLFSLTYYANIITACFNMPAVDNRYQLLNMGPPGGPGDFSFEVYRWITPSVSGAIWGMLIYSVICLALAWNFFRRRQVKN